MATLVCSLMMFAGIGLNASAARQNEWVLKSGKVYYYNANGKKTKGLSAINGKYYYFDKKGVQHAGWQKIGKYYYYFKPSYKAKGYMVTNKKVDGVKLAKNGRAKVTSSIRKKLQLMVKARQLVESNTKANMTKKEQLRKCFDYAKTKFRYFNRGRFSYSKTWDQTYAGHMLLQSGGDCYASGCAFAYMAKAIGYTDVKCISSGGHGWAEVNGKVYDPNWARYSKVDSYFGMSYSLSGVGGRPRYRQSRRYIISL